MRRFKKTLIVIILCIVTAFSSTITLPLFGCKKPTRKTYVVSFNCDGGSQIEQINVNEGEAVTQPTPPTKEGFEFVCWLTTKNEKYDFSQSVTENITLVASWKAKTPTPPDNPDEPKPDSPASVKHDVCFYDGETLIVKEIVVAGESVKVPTTPQKEGYEFVRWEKEDGTAFDFSTKITSQLKIMAKWQEKGKDPVTPEPPNPNEPVTPTVPTKYTVTFNPDGGEGVINQLVVSGEKAVDPETPTKSGYVFDKWVDESGEVFNFNTPITQDITLKATWKVAHYLVVFNCDGGSEIDTQFQTSGEKAIRPTNPTKLGFTFAGWLKEDGSEYDFNSAVVADITLTAKWTANVDTPTPSTKTDTFTYDYTAISGEIADKASMTQANFTGANSFITVAAEKKVTYRNKTKSADGKSPDCIEVKDGGLSVTFKGTGTITISFASTGSTNISSLELRKADGTNVAATSKGDAVTNTDGVYTITGTNADSVTFTITEAGTYTIYCSYSYTNATTGASSTRGARITAITMQDNYTE